MPGLWGDCGVSGLELASVLPAGCCGNSCLRLPWAGGELGCRPRSCSSLTVAAWLGCTAALLAALPWGWCAGLATAPATCRKVDHAAWSRSILPTVLWAAALPLVPGRGLPAPMPLLPGRLPRALPAWGRRMAEELLLLRPLALALP